MRMVARLPNLTKTLGRKCLLLKGTLLFGDLNLIPGNHTHESSRSRGAYSSPNILSLFFILRLKYKEIFGIVFIVLIKCILAFYHQ